ncbi:MAG: Fe-S cluster assembly protein SufD [Planctomycetota bacterium]|jgi:Fe-S cluster assembly protein SufD
MIETIREQDLYAADFERFLQSPGGRALVPTRQAAFARFGALGFPTTRHEEWRFTNVAPIAKTAFCPVQRDERTVQAADLAADAPLVGDWPRLVFVNGYFCDDLSSRTGLPEAVGAGDLAGGIAGETEAVSKHLARYASYEQHAFTALNTAFMADGALIHVPAETSLEQPLELLFVSTGGADPVVAHPRNLIVAEAGSRVTIIERYVGLGGGPYFNNAVTELVVGENAVVDHYKIGQEATRAYHVGATQFYQARDSSVSSHAVTIGGAIVRNDITTVLDGPGAHCTLNGLYLVSGRQHVDNHLRVEHAKPNCDSREYFKGVLHEQARAVFTGRIVVHKDAQKTDAKQTNMNMLLSEDAQVDTKPQLEIFADDVKCTHGATVGQIDEEAIFYLRSRGIDEAMARDILVFAFAQESLELIGPEPLRRQLQDVLLERLPQGELLREAI